MRRQFEQNRPLMVRGIAGLIGLNTLIAGIDVMTYDRSSATQVLAPAPEATVQPQVVSRPVLKPKPSKVHHAVPKPQPKPHAVAALKPEKPQVHYGPISFAQYRSNPYRYLKLLPNLEQLHQQFPKQYSEQDVQGLKAKIAELKVAVHPTVDDYKKFSVDTSHEQAFTAHPFYNDRANMQLFAFHWTAEDHDLNPDEIAYKMMHRTLPSGKLLRTSVAFYEGHQAQPVVSEMIQGLGHKTATVAGANDFSQSVEIAGEVINGQSPLFDMSPEQFTTAVMLGVKVLRQQHLPVEAWRLVDHTEMDLLFNNDDYSPATGRFAAGADLRKGDFPPGVMSDIIVPQALRLNAELNQAGINY